MNESADPVSPRSRALSGAPWALLLAIGMVIAVDALVRTKVPAAVLTQYRDGDDQLRSVKNAMDAAPVAEVALIGSSQVHQGFAVPELERKLEALMGRPVRVGNYAIRGGVIDTYDAAVRHLLSQPTKPKLIVVGTSMRDLRNRRPVVERLGEFWTVGDWWEARGTFNRDELLPLLPVAGRNTWGELSATLRYRDGLRAWLVTRLVDVSVEQSPAFGARPSQHQGSRSIRSLADNLSAFSHPRNKRRMIQTYRPEFPAKPAAQIRDYIGSIIRQCEEAGVGVMCVDMPISPPLRDLMDNAQRKTKTRDASRTFDPEYRKAMFFVTKPANVSFVTMPDLALDMPTEQFYDGQHLNLSGAVRLGDALAPVIADKLQPAK